MEKLNIKIWEKLSALKILMMEARDFIGESYVDLLIFIPISLYAAIFSYYTILKHYTFNSYAWDLGVFNQALYTTLYHGRLLFYTADLYVNPSGSYLAIHFSPILFLLLPLYALSPSIENLLVIKASILALGALPLYFLAKETLKSRRAAFIFAIAYLLHPAIQGSNWFDFQQQIFIPILTFSSIYFMAKERWKIYFITVVLSLMISEHATIAFLALSLYYLLTGNTKRIPFLLKKLEVRRETAVFLAVFMSLISFYISECVKKLFPVQPEFLDIYIAADAYRVLGFKGPTYLLPIYLILNPGKALGALLYDYPIKLMYIVFLFAPLAFLPFGSKMTIVTLALLAPFLVSNYPAYYKIGAHYPLYVIAPIFLAAIDALSNRTKKDMESALKIIMVSSLIFIISVSPLSPVSITLEKAKILWYPTSISTLVVNSEVESVHRILELIPRNASVLTENAFFPHVSDRINAYVIPLLTGVCEQRKFLEKYVRELIDKSEYVLLDATSDNYWTQFILNEVANGSLFGLYGFTRRAILFKRNYIGPMQSLNEISFPIQNLYLKFGSVVNDESSESGRVAFCPKGSRGIFIYGPYVFLPSGVYNVTWVIKANKYGEEHLGVLEVTEKFGEIRIAKRDLYGFDIEPDEWSNITVTLEVNRAKMYVEFRIYSTGAADIYLDHIVLRQISGEAKNEFAAGTFNFRDLRVNGKVTSEGFLLYPDEGGKTAWSFWYGPYISLPPGKYRVTFNLKVEPDPKIEDKIIRLEIAKNYGIDIIAGIDIYGKNVSENISSSKWCKINLEFSTETPVEKVEFRGVDPSEKYKIYLAYILLERIS